MTERALELELAPYRAGECLSPYGSSERCPAAGEGQGAIAHSSCPHCMIWRRCNDPACDHPACKHQRWYEWRDAHPEFGQRPDVRLETGEAKPWDGKLAPSWRPDPKQSAKAPAAYKLLARGGWHKESNLPGGTDALMQLLAEGARFEIRSYRDQSPIWIAFSEAQGWDEVPGGIMGREFRLVDVQAAPTGAQAALF